MKKSFITKGLMSLIAASTLMSSTTVFAKTTFSGEYRLGEILSFGSSLTKNEELALREYFEVPEDMDAIYVNNKTAIEQLGLAPDALDDYKGGWYSSAYVKLTEGDGIQIKSNNINLVTDEMFASALLTSGILSCDVNISAPFSVTGESALAGILAGIEEILGESLPEENKVVAKDEIDTTLDVADDILNDTSNDVNTSQDSAHIASAIVAEIKQQVIQNSPDAAEIEKIIENVSAQYGIELSDATQTRMLGLMEDVNDLDIDYNEIKDVMENIGSDITSALKEAGIKLKESGLLDKMIAVMKELLQFIIEWVQEIFEGNNATAINFKSFASVSLFDDMTNTQALTAVSEKA